MLGRSTLSAAQQPKCAVCYVTDLEFAFPTIVSVLKLRDWISPDDAAIYIFTIGIDERILER